jgi:hypothetical protein
MPRVKRKDVLAAIRIAGYHGDKERGLSLYIENRVSLHVYRREFNNGAEMRENGAPCACFRCAQPRVNSDQNQASL